MANVVIFGATGYIGHPVAAQLAKAGVPTTAVVRNAGSSDGERKQKLDHLKGLGVNIVEGSADAELTELVKLLKDYNTVVSALSGQDLGTVQLKLVEAAKQAGTIRRFFPSEFGGDYPTEGPYAHVLSPAVRDFLRSKERTNEALAAAGIANTRVISYAFFGWSVAHLGDVGFAGQPLGKEVKVYGDGKTKAVFSHEDDIGAVVAKAVNDSRTENTKLLIRANEASQSQIIETWERVTGKHIERKAVSAADLDKQIEGGEGFGKVAAGLLKTFYIDGLYSVAPDKLAPHESFRLASELYPDLTFTSIEQYFRERA